MLCTPVCLNTWQSSKKGTLEQNGRIVTTTTDQLQSTAREAEVAAPCAEPPSTPTPAAACRVRGGVGQQGAGAPALGIVAVDHALKRLLATVVAHHVGQPHRQGRTLL